MTQLCESETLNRVLTLPMSSDLRISMLRLNVEECVSLCERSHPDAYRRRKEAYRRWSEIAKCYHRLIVDDQFAEDAEGQLLIPGLHFGVALWRMSESDLFLNPIPLREMSIKKIVAAELDPRMTHYANSTDALHCETLDFASDALSNSFQELLYTGKLAFVDAVAKVERLTPALGSRIRTRLRYGGWDLSSPTNNSRLQTYPTCEDSDDELSEEDCLTRLEDGEFFATCS